MAKKQTTDEFLEQSRKRWSTANEHDRRGRESAVADLEFAAGEQWPESIKTYRDNRNLPCLTIDRLSPAVDQVVGELLQNKPAIKVRPSDKDASKQTAAILAGKVRDIEYKSSSDVVYETAGTSATICGRGWIRVITQYKDETSFEQEIRIKRITNQMSVRWDPSASDYNLDDAGYMFVSKVMSDEDFKREYPNAAPIDFEDEELYYDEDWYYQEGVRVAEYFYKEKTKRTIYQLADGSVTDKKPADKAEITSSRVTTLSQIMWCKVSGHEILEGPRKWDGKYFPLIPVWGKELFVGTRRDMMGIVRKGKDAQRYYNYFRSKSAEVVALAPSAPWVVSDGQAQGHETQWQTANEAKNVLLYKDVQGVDKPSRAEPPRMSVGLTNETAILADEIKVVTGKHDASLGARSNETSGKAILYRQQEGDNASFVYSDHLRKAIQQTGRVILDLIPVVQSGEGSMRIRNEDGSERFVTVNKVIEIGGEYDEKIDTVTQIDEETGILNDLSAGEYDVIVDAGPSYKTQRMEMSDTLLEFIRTVPDSAPILGPLLAQSMDWPMADDIEKRLELLLPQEIREELHKDDDELEGGQGLADEQEQAEQQDPVAIMEMEKAKLELRTADANARKAEAEADEAEVKADLAKLEIVGKAKESAIDVAAGPPPA